MKGAQRSPGGDEWIAVRRRLPGWIMEGEPYRPEMVLVMDPASGLVLDVKTFAREDSLPTIAAWVAERVEHLPRGSGRPRLRLGDDELASLLPQRLGASWDVVVAPTPEASEALASLAAALSVSPGAGGHFVDGATPEVVGPFFGAAARLFRAAPWRAASDAQVLAVDAPTFGYENACLCIIGALGEHFGVLVYRSIEDYLSVVRAAIGRSPTMGPGVLTFAVNLDSASSVGRRLRQEAKQKGWPVERGGFPTIMHVEADGVLRPLSGRDYAFAAALLESLTRFMAEHGHVFTRHHLTTPVHVGHQDEAGAVVSITAPHPRATWGWGDSADAAALAAGENRSRRRRRSAATE